MTDSTNNQSSIINNQWKNEPNLTPNFSSTLPPIYSFTRRKARTFAQKTKQMRDFCNFQTQTHLTPCTTKAYITFHPKIPFTRGVYPPFVRREKMQNEPNLLSAQMNLSEVDLISRPWRIQQNNQSSIIDNQWKGPISKKTAISAYIARTYGYPFIQLFWLERKIPAGEEPSEHSGVAIYVGCDGKGVYRMPLKMSSLSPLGRRKVSISSSIWGLPSPIFLWFDIDKMHDIWKKRRISWT